MRDGRSDDQGTGHERVKKEDDELLIPHMILADNCCILASSMLAMSQLATEKIIQGSALDERDLEFTMKTVSTTKIPRVQEMLATGSLLSNDADTMSSMRHRMNKTMSAMRAEMYVCYTNPGIPLKEGDTRDTIRLYRPACCTRRKQKSWTKELADLLHGADAWK